MGRDNKSMNPNSFDQEIKDAQTGANPEAPQEGTEAETTVEKPVADAEPTIDYQKKFAESAKEAQRLYEENKILQALAEAKGTEVTTENLYPGFENLDEDAKNNLIAYTEAIAKRTKEEVLKDPSIAEARTIANEARFERALSSVMDKYPELKSSREDFKSKYYNPNLVPSNIESILEDVSKMYLFDRAKDLGVKEEKARANRVDLEKSTGGEKTPHASRSLSDWLRMSRENPQQFAKLSKEYQTDLESGKLKE